MKFVWINQGMPRFVLCVYNMGFTSPINENKTCNIHTQALHEFQIGGNSNGHILGFVSILLAKCPINVDCIYDTNG